MNIDFYSIGLRIQHARNKRKLTQEELAEKVGFLRSSISEIENGNKGLSLDGIIRICNALEISSDELLLDNLTHSFFNDESDIPYLLLDCSENESKIITSTLFALKNALKKFNIK